MRTADGRVYLFRGGRLAAEVVDRAGIVHAYRATTTGLPAGFAEADAAHRPHSTASTGLLNGVDVRLDRAGSRTSSTRTTAALATSSM